MVETATVIIDRIEAIRIARGDNSVYGGWRICSVENSHVLPDARLTLPPLGNFIG